MGDVGANVGLTEGFLLGDANEGWYVGENVGVFVGAMEEADGVVDGVDEVVKDIQRIFINSTQCYAIMIRSIMIRSYRRPS